MLRIGVIGAGIVGLSSALNVQEAFPNAKIVIMADKFEGETVSHGAGGLFRPDYCYIPKGNKAQVIKQCIRDSWKHFSGLAMSQKAKESGQMFISGWVVHHVPKDADYELMKECAFDFHQIPPSELQRRGIPFEYGYSSVTVVTQTPIYIRWLMEQFKRKGGEVQTRTVNSIEELYGEYDLVINCCGGRAGTFLGDKECKPVKGQLVMVKAPWIKQYYFSDGDVYLIPHLDKVIVGGIRLKGDGSTDVDPQLSDSILKNAEAIFPELKGAERLYSWAGSRPARTEVRLETEIMELGNNRKLPVVHNYGHGGQGITLSWGTGVQVAKLAQQTLGAIPKSLL